MSVTLSGTPAGIGGGASTSVEPGPYANSGTLTLNGEVFRPEGFKYPRAEITLSGQDKMTEEGGHPKAIGSINVRDDLLQAYIFVPIESMGKLTSLAACDRIADHSYGRHSAKISKRYGAQHRSVY